MLCLLSDEDFHGHIVRGMLRNQPDVDLVRVQDVGLLGASDPDVLAWAADHDRIVVTHDRATVPTFAAERIALKEPMPGLFVVPRSMRIRQAIEELLLLAICTDPSDWMGIVLYLPV